MSGKHPLSIQPLLEARESAFTRIRAGKESQHPLIFFGPANYVRMTGAFIDVIEAYAAVPVPNKMVRMEAYDAVVDVTNASIRRFFPQPDMTEIWMIAELVAAHNMRPMVEQPLLRDFSNYFFVGKYAVTFTWDRDTREFWTDAEPRSGCMCPAGSRIWRPVYELD